MDEAKRQEVGKKLVDMRKEVLDEARRRGDLSTDVGVEVGDEADLSVADEQASLLAQLGSRERERVMAIDDAIHRLNQGTYGECRDCGERISEQRLEAQPLAERCVDCQETWEQERSAPGDSKRRKM